MITRRHMLATTAGFAAVAAAGPVAAGAPTPTIQSKRTDGTTPHETAIRGNRIAFADSDAIGSHRGDCDHDRFKAHSNV
jgi:hypothetical protein